MTRGRMKNVETACLRSFGGEPVVLEGVRVEGDLRGVLLEMTVEQRFRNPTDSNLEVVYSFPLPWGAVLLGVEVMLGSKRLDGSVVEKKKAEAKYEEALSEGDAAIMLEQNEDHSYSLNLGNLAAKEPCVVTLRYAQVLSYEQRALRALVPTVIAPRYGDPVKKGRLRPHQVPETDITAEYPFEITLRLHGELAKGRVASPSHPTAMSMENGVVTVALAQRGMLDRDFVLVVDRLAHDAVGLQALDGTQPGTQPDMVAVLASFCPRIEAEGPVQVAAKVLVDCSGSMAGDSIEAAKRALQAVVLGLATGDKFSLSRFGSTVAHRSRGLWSVTDATRLAAQRWIGGLEADLGGTDMEEALASTFQLTPATGADVLLVTDGQISDIDGTIRAARASGHRLFVVGVGSSTAEIHLRRLAEATGGACDFVAAGEAVEPAVMRMFARLRSPRLTGVQIEWPGGVQPVWVSPLSGAVFDADTVSVYALLPSRAEGQATLRGMRADGVVQEIGKVSLSQPFADDGLLGRVVAAVRIKALEAAGEVAHRAEMTDLAVRYQLISAQTNFLLVHGRAADEKAVDMPELHKVRQMVPAGWGGVGSVMLSAARSISASTDMSSVSMSYEHDSVSVPSVWRTNRAVAASAMSDRMDDFELPAFLRRSGEHDAASQDRGNIPPRLDAKKTAMLKELELRRNPMYWSPAKDDSGWTPAGVKEWLLIHDRSEWPQTFAALLKMGLSHSVVDWLELSVGASFEEADVVRVFIWLLATQNAGSLGAIDLSKGLETLSDANRASEGGSLAEHVALSPEAANQIGNVLNRSKADQWPDAVYALQA